MEDRPPGASLCADMLPVKRKSAGLHQGPSLDDSQLPADSELSAAGSAHRLCATQCSTPTSSSGGGDGWHCCGRGGGGSPGAAGASRQPLLEEGAACGALHKSAKTCSSVDGDVLPLTGGAGPASALQAPPSRDGLASAPAQALRSCVSSSAAILTSSSLRQQHQEQTHRLCCQLLSLEELPAGGACLAEDGLERCAPSQAPAAEQAEDGAAQPEFASAQLPDLNALLWQPPPSSPPEVASDSLARTSWEAAAGSGAQQLQRQSLPPPQQALWHQQPCPREPALIAEGAEQQAAAAAAASRWPDLPDDIVARLLSQLPPSHLRVLRLVCSGWERAVARAVRGLRPEALARKRLAVRFPNLTSLDLSHCHLAVDFRTPSSLRLQSLLRDADLAELAPLERLRELSLHACDGLDGSGLAHLPPSLTALDLTHCTRLGDAGLRCLARAGLGLEALTLAGCGVVTAAGLAALLPLRRLRQVTLQGGFGNAALQALAGLPQLRRLTLRRCPCITADGVCLMLLAAPALQRLVVVDCPQINSGSMDQLVSCKDGLLLSVASRRSQGQTTAPPPPQQQGALPAGIAAFGLQHVAAGGVWVFAAGQPPPQPLQMELPPPQQHE